MEGPTADMAAELERRQRWSEEQRGYYRDDHNLPPRGQRQPLYRKPVAKPVDKR